ANRRALKGLGPGPGNPLPLGREHRAVTWAIPCQVRVVPGHGATHVRAGRGQGVRVALHIPPHRTFLLSLLSHSARTRLDVFKRTPDRLTVAAAIEVLGHAARR